MQKDSQLTEDSLRQALSRLGANNERSSRHQSSIRSSNSERESVSFPRKRRSSNEHSVIVEHSPQSRRSQSRYQSDARIENTHVHELQNDVVRLQRELRDEKRRYREAQGELETLKRRFQSVETQLAHYHIQADEQQKALESQQQENIRIKSDLEHARGQDKVVARRQKRKKNIVTSVDAENELRPVQWWKD